MLAVALALRFVGLGYGLPHASEPDTYIVSQVDVLEREGLGNRYVAGWKYPHLIGSIAALTPGGALGDAAPEGASVAEHREAAAAPYLRVRRVVAALSALVAPATFLIALRFLALRWALLAGIAAGASLLTLSLSTQGRPHAAVAATVAVAMLACVRYAERPRLARALIAGTAVGLAASTLHFGASAAASLVAAWAVSARRDRGERSLRAVARLAAGLAVAAAISAWFHLQSPDGKNALTERLMTERIREGRIRDTLGEVWVSGHWLPKTWFSGEGWSDAWLAFAGYDPTWSALAAIGLVAGVAGWRRRGAPAPAAWIVAAAAVPTLLVLGMYSLSFPRFYASLTAPLALLAACGTRSLTRSHRAGAAVAAALVIAGFAAAVRWSALRTRPDTYEATAAALESSGALDAPVLAVNLAGLPLASLHAPDDAVRGEGAMPWDKYQFRLDAPIPGAADLRFATLEDLIGVFTAADPEAAAAALLEGSGARHALLSVTPPNVGPEERARYARLVGLFRAAFRARGWQRAGVIEGPADADGGHAIGYSVTIGRLLGATRYGPAIEIWSR